LRGLSANRRYLIAFDFVIPAKAGIQELFSIHVGWGEARYAEPQPTGTIVMPAKAGIQLIK
jgi:hypothetical protein